MTTSRIDPLRLAIVAEFRSRASSERKEAHAAYESAQRRADAYEVLAEAVARGKPTDPLGVLLCASTGAALSSAAILALAAGDTLREAITSAPATTVAPGIDKRFTPR